MIDIFINVINNKYFKNTTWLFVEKFFRTGVTFLVSIYVIRYLGPHNLGLLSYAQSYVGIFAGLAKLGMSEITVKQLVIYPENKNKILGTSLILKLIVSIFVFLIILVSSLIFEEKITIQYLIIILSLGLIFSSFDVIDFFFQAKVMSKYPAFIRTLVSVIISFLKIYLIFIKANLLTFGIVFVFENFLVMVLLIYFFTQKSSSLLRWSFEKKIAKDILLASFPILLISIMINIYMKIDQIMLKNMLNIDSVGLYAVAAKLSEFWYIIPVIISQSLFPAIIKSRNLSAIKYERRMQRLYDLLTLISVSIAIIFTFFSDFIVVKAFGDEFIKSGDILSIHIWAGIFVFYGTARGKWIIVENLQKKVIFIHLASTILNILFNLILIPIYGGLGAAIATLFSYALSCISTGILIKEFRRQLWLFFVSLYNCFTLISIKRLLSGKL